MLKLSEENSTEELLDIIIKASEYNSITKPLHLIQAIIKSKSSNAYKLLNKYITCATLSDLYELNELSLNQEEDNNETKDECSISFTRLIECADNEKNFLEDEKMASEHFLLAILNPINKFDEAESFLTYGLIYQSIYDKCAQDSAEKKEKAKTDKKEKSLTPLKKKKSNPAINLDSFTNPPQATTSKTPYIDEYCNNINKDIDEKGYSPIFGREKEINELISVLLRKKKNNAILVGENGVGKTSIIYALAKLINDGKVPSLLENKTIIELDMIALVAGTTLRGMLEERIKNIFDELKAHPKYILFIDDIHNALKSSSKDKDSDISDQLMDILKNEEIRLIGTTSFEMYHSTIEYNTSFEQKIKKIIINENTIDETVNILNNIKKEYELFHNVEYSSDVLKYTASLASNYITNRKLPDSAIDLIDAAGAVRNTIIENKLSSIKNSLLSLKKKKNSLIKKGEFEEAKKIEEKINEVKLQVADTKRNKKKEPNYKITEQDIANIVSSSTGIPINSLCVTNKKKISLIEECLNKTVIGQKEAVKEIANVMKKSAVGLKNTSKVIGSFMFIGNPGVGKTYLAKQLAKNVFGSEKDLIKIDMSEYSEESAVSKLIGANAGYIGYDKGGVLTEAIKKHQHCVLLFDEIEKSNEKVFNLFLQLLDEGQISDNTGQAIDFKNTIIIMTSNIGARQASMVNEGLGFASSKEDSKKAIYQKELKRKFAPEFLNRIDKIIYFNSLSSDDIKEITKIELQKIKTEFNNAGYLIKFDEDGSVENKIIEDAAKSKETGARPISKIAHNLIENCMTEEILRENFDSSNEYTIAYSQEMGIYAVHGCF